LLGESLIDGEPEGIEDGLCVLGVDSMGLGVVLNDGSAEGTEDWLIDGRGEDCSLGSRESSTEGCIEGIGDGRPDILGDWLG